MHPDPANPGKARIDAHHHLWRYARDEFSWIDEEMSEIRRDFLPKDLAPVLRESLVDATVAVQARQVPAETQWLLEAAAQHPVIAGVVGWLPIASPDFAKDLERYASKPLLVGLRHVVQGEPAGFLDRPAFNAGIAQLRGTGLTYDLLIHEGQLEETIRFADRHPDQPFVLDHLAKPKIARGEMEPWRTGIRELARRPGVSCKLSGMVTEADPRTWTAEQLRPYFDVVLDAFGPRRLMVGSDWPVLTVACEYRRWWLLVEQWISTLSSTEQAEILGETARRVYSLQLPSERLSGEPVLAGREA